MTHTLPTLSALAEVSETPLSFPQVFEPRHDGWTPDKMSDFIDRLGESGNITEASRVAGMSVQSCYRLRRHPEAALFAAAWDAAIAASFEALTDLAMERVRHGTPRVVRWKGEIVGIDHQVSDTLLMFMMRQRDPTRYATRAALSPTDASPAAPLFDRYRSAHHEFADLLQAGGLPGDDEASLALAAANPEGPSEYIHDNTIGGIDAMMKEMRRPDEEAWAAQIALRPENQPPEKKPRRRRNLRNTVKNR